MILFHRLDAQIKAYNAAIERYNAAPTADAQNALLPELEQARKAWEEANARFRHGSDATYFGERFKGHLPPTRYGQTNPTEFHAEAYWLYKTEPERLAEFDADLFAYFQNGDHLEHWIKDAGGAWVVEPVAGDADAPVPGLSPPRSLAPDPLATVQPQAA